MQRKLLRALGLIVATATFAWFQFVGTKYKAFKIPAGSMIPALQVGDHIMVDRRIKTVQRGDVVVFRYPKDPSKDFVKRVVAVGGDTVEMHDHVLSINGKPLPSRKLGEPCSYEDFDEEQERWDSRPCSAVEETLDGHTYKVVYNSDDNFVPWTGPLSIPPGTFFVLGDNRDNSHDSRFWGTVPLDHLLGKAVLVHWSSGAHGLRKERFGMRIQ